MSKMTRHPASDARLVAMKRCLDGSLVDGHADDYGDLFRAICTKLDPADRRRFDEIERRWGESGARGRPA